jgi:cellulose synthase/poly-beta-1,6-N-acetylglucosamine synthase-like glycosyltransferase
MEVNKPLPLISIIVPIYNIAEYASECIQSLINQTYKNIEIILVMTAQPIIRLLSAMNLPNKTNGLKLSIKEMEDSAMHVMQG